MANRKTINNNIIRFPAILGARFRVNNSKTSTNLLIQTKEGMEVDGIDNCIFYGNKLVLRFYGASLNLYDLWLYFQIIEKYQKNPYKIEEKVEFDIDYELSMDAKKILFEEYKVKYKNDMFHLDGGERKLFLKNKIDEEIEKRIEKIEKDLYLNSKESIVTDIDFGEILKDRGLLNDVKSRESIVSSLERLNSVGLSWHVLSEELSNDFKKIKQKHNNNSTLYKEELKQHFDKYKRKSTTYLRSLLSSASISREFSTGIVRMDKKFYELTMNSQLFDFSILKKIKGNMGKTLYVNLNFAYKPKMTKEYLYDILSLSPENRDDNKLASAKKAVEELKRVGVLDVSSGYDKESKSFEFNITEEYKGIMGLKSQIEFSKNKPTKVGRKK